MLLGWDGYFRPLEVRTVQSVVGPCHLDAVGTRGPVLYVDQYMRCSKGSWSGLSPTCSQQEASPVPTQPGQIAEATATFTPRDQATSVSHRRKPEVLIQVRTKYLSF